ncbi:uncharacterized protein [Rutidosis leptorrhynchoides]|uniref:uncharacterized protein n=1 Tax=Rutidosis leptorrhynchoides TaxID=125765 RepID=UPI003A99CCDF
MSMRRASSGYEPLGIGGAPVDDLLKDAKMIRSRTMPTNFFGDSSVSFEYQQRTPMRENVIDKQVKKASKVHPIFAIFERRSRKKKATAKPEFSRYMQYLKEGGSWNADESKPAIY